MGKILLSHLCSSLSVQLTYALMCVEEWSLMGYVKNSDVTTVVMLPDLEGDEKEPSDSWDDNCVVP
jgi:hypothetical protein